MKCPHCGYILGPFDQTCPKCAYLARTRQVPAGVQTPVPPGPAQPPPAPMGTLPTGQPYKICPVCGQPAVPAMPACGRCGYAYTTQPGSPQQTQAIPPAGYAVPSRLPPAYPAPMGPSDVPRTQRRWAAALGAGLSLLLLVAFALSFHAHGSRQRGAPGLLIIQSGGGQTGTGLVGAAVDTTQFDQRLLSAGAATGGELEVSLAWNSLTDLDLEVRDPFGELITAVHRRSASGGVQDVDANPTLTTEEGSERAAAGLNPGPENVLPLPEILVDLDQKAGLPSDIPGLDSLPGFDGRAPSRFTRTPVEHIYFAHAPQGIYTVYAHCYSWREPNYLPLPFTVQVRSHGRVFYTTSGTLGPASYITDNTMPTQVCQFRIQ